MTLRERFVDMSMGICQNCEKLAVLAYVKGYLVCPACATLAELPPHLRSGGPQTETSTEGLDREQQ